MRFDAVKKLLRRGVAPRREARWYMDSGHRDPIEHVGEAVEMIRVRVTQKNGVELGHPQSPKSGSDDATPHALIPHSARVVERGPTFGLNDDRRSVADREKVDPGLSGSAIECEAGRQPNEKENQQPGTMIPLGDFAPPK